MMASSMEHQAIPKKMQSGLVPQSQTHRQSVMLTKKPLLGAAGVSIGANQVRAGRDMVGEALMI